MCPIKRKSGAVVSADTVKSIIRADVTKEQLDAVVDLLKATRNTAGVQAKAMGLEGRSALRIAGFGAYELQSRRLPELGRAHGATVVEEGCFPGTELRIFQPIIQYRRVLFGKASIPDAGELPARNVTRVNCAQMNARHGKVSYLPGMGPTLPSEDLVHVLLLTARDRNDATAYADIGIGAIEPDFSAFIFYESLPKFIDGYDSLGADRPAPKHPTGHGSLGLVLKDGVAPFQGSEAQDGDAVATRDKKSS